MCDTCLGVITHHDDPNTHHPHTPATTCTLECKPCDEHECMVDPGKCAPCF